MTAGSERKPLPGAWPLVGHFPAYARDPLGFAQAAAAEPDGVASFSFGPSDSLLVAGPAAAEEILVTRHRDFVKGRAFARIGVVVGDGLLLSEGETWRARRRIVGPAFRHERVVGWGAVMVDEAERLVDAWLPGEVADVQAAMSALTLAIVGRTLLDSDISPADVATIQSATATLTDHFDSRFNGLAYFIPDWLPTPGNRRMRAAVREVDAIVYRLIAARRAGQRGDDAISLLLDASEAEGQELTDRELRDEVMTLLMAGHETTAVALTWSLDLLARHPAAQAAVATEVAAVTGDRSPTVADVPALPITTSVVNEALRLYPPAYAISREAATDTTIAGCPLPRRGIGFISVRSIQRRPDLYEAPDAFVPARWQDDRAQSLPRGAFIPFAEGPRKCVGAAFAMQEMILVLATIVGRLELSPVGAEPVAPRPSATLRPGGPVRVGIAHRTAPAGQPAIALVAGA